MESSEFRKHQEVIDAAREQLSLLNRDLPNTLKLSQAFSCTNAVLLIDIAEMLNAFCEAENIYEKLRSK